MKTIEDKAKEIRANSLLLLGVSKTIDYVTVSIREESAFLKGVEFAQRWIPVEEELPKYLTDVLLKQGNGKISIGGFMDSQFNVEHLNRSKVTHWRPIELK